MLGFGLFTAILFQIGNHQKTFSRHLELYTEFSKLGGLGSGAKVRVSGLDAGQIKKIEIPKDPSIKFRLLVQIEESYLSAPLERISSGSETSESMESQRSQWRYGSCNGSKEIELRPRGRRAPSPRSQQGDLRSVPCEEHARGRTGKKITAAQLAQHACRTITSIPLIANKSKSDPGRLKLPDGQRVPWPKRPDTERSVL